MQPITSMLADVSRYGFSGSLRDMKWYPNNPPQACRARAQNIPWGADAPGMHQEPSTPIQILSQRSFPRRYCFTASTSSSRTCITMVMHFFTARSKVFLEYASPVRPYRAVLFIHPATCKKKVIQHRLAQGTLVSNIITRVIRSARKWATLRLLC